MVIHGLPLWELGQSYKWVPRDYAEALTQIVSILNHGAVEAASPPVADAGSDKSFSKNQPVGSSITLDGSGSYDPDDDPLTFQWYGPFATTSGSSISKTISEGMYTVSLVVDDNMSRSDIDTATLEIIPCFNISARAKSGKVQLTWTHLNSTEQYDIYRANESDPFGFEKIGETTSTYSTCLDDTVSNETTYLYVVGAYDSGTWCYSDVISSHPTALRTRANYAPIIYSSAITNGMTGIIYNYDVNATDPNGDALSYSLIAHPSGMDIDPDTGLITWIPDEAGSFDVTVHVADGSGGTDIQTFIIVVEDITAPNRAPVADAGPDQTVFVIDTVQLDGSGSSDADGDALTYEWSFVSAPEDSTAGISDPASVNPTFTVDFAGTYVVQLIVNDGTVDSEPNTVTISTENSPPVANAGPDQTVFMYDTVTLDGSGSTDVDGDLLTFTWLFVSVPDGSTASFSDPGSVEPTFLVDVGGTYVIQLIVNDGSLDSDPHTVTISTENRKPVADAGSDQTVFFGDTVTLDGSRSTDADGDLLTFIWSFTSMPDGSTAILSDPTVAAPSFDIDEPGIYVVQLIVNDGMLNSDPDTVTISTENRKPVADAGPDQTAFVTDTITLDGSGSTDVDGDPLSFEWSFTSIPSGSAAALSDLTVVNPTFALDMPGTYTVQLIVNDGMVDSDPNTITITTENSPPVANAGPDQTVLVTETVQLDGSTSSDVDGDALTCQWHFISIPPGSTAIFSDSTIVNPTFVIDLPGTYTVQLIINDGTVDSDPDSVVISTGNSRPVAAAGPDQTVYVTDTVQLDGSASIDVDGDIVTYEWSFVSVPAGSTAGLSDSTLVNPSFAVDLSGTYVLQLVVNDGTVDSEPDTVTISTQNSPPVANSGPDQTVFVGDTVQLNGSGSSDVDGDLLTFNWSLISIPDGSTAIISDPAAVTPVLEVDGPGSYVVQLIVNDGTVDSGPDTVTVTTENSSPIADAGPAQTVFVNGTVQLDGSSSSDADGDLLTFMWSFTSRPDGSTATLSDSTLVNPTFAADLPGTYTVQLIVNDGTADSNPDSVVISTQNSRPVANAGSDQAVSVNDTVALDGSASSDADGDPLTCQWSFTSIPSGSGASLSDPAAIDPTFEADLPGTYVVQLIVNDGELDSEPDTAVITTENRKPVADAGPDQTVNQGDTVQLNGSSSTDPDGDPLNYSWSLTSVPSGSTAILSNPVIANPTFVADLSGTYVAQLVVNDGMMNSDPDTVTITAAEQMITVPDFVGMSQTEAETAVTSAGLAVGTITQQYSDTVPAGDVISQDPAAGASVVIGTAVSFVVSLEQQMVTVPDVVGQLQADAEAAITDAGLAVGNTTETNSDTVPAGNVISQNPPAGTSVPEGSAVDLLISLGPVVEEDYEKPELFVQLNHEPPMYASGEDVIMTITASDNSGSVTVETLLDGNVISTTLPNTIIGTSGLDTGNHTIVVTATDPSNNSASENRVFVITDTGDTVSPIASITSPDDGNTVTELVDITGTASDTNLFKYEIAYAPMGNDDFTVFKVGTESVTNGVLGKFDPALVTNGLYTIRLSVTDGNGRVVSDEICLNCKGEQEIGNFSITFRDLEVNIGELPITINRVYDSRKRGVKGDFGYGWSIDLIRGIKAESNDILGEGWTQTVSGGWLGNTYCIAPVSGREHYMIVTYPGGKQEKFLTHLFE